MRYKFIIIGLAVYALQMPLFAYGDNLSEPGQLVRGIKNQKLPDISDTINAAKNNQYKGEVGDFSINRKVEIQENKKDVVATPEQVVRSIENRKLPDATDLINSARKNQYKGKIEDFSKNKLKVSGDKNGEIATTQGVNINNLLSRYQPQLEDAEKAPKKINQLLIFISLSMPKDSLKQLSAQAERAGGLLVLRGLVNNSFMETAKAMQEASVNAVIDPRMFEVFDIKTTPSFVVLPTSIQVCKDGKCDFTPLHDKLSGNVSLDYALEQVQNRGKVSNKVATSYLNKLRGKV